LGDVHPNKKQAELKINKMPQSIGFTISTKDHVDLTKYMTVTNELIGDVLERIHNNFKKEI